MNPDLSATRSTPATGDDLGALLRNYMDVSGRLQRTHEALQEEVARLRAELASKDRELELRRRLAALGELAAGVAHEVRNPLGAIRLYSGLLRNQCEALQSSAALELVAKIEAGIQAIDGVVTDTLALAPRDRQVHPCRLREVIDKAHDAARSVLLERQVSLAVQLADEHVRVRVDAAGLQRVLVNLLINAADASPPQGVIRVESAPGPLGMVELRVADEGPGLPEEILHRVFDPFFTTKEHGTGLGLTIAHRLLDAYGGEIRAHNGATGGAEFVLRLPEDSAAAVDEATGDAQQFTAA